MLTNTNPLTLETLAAPLNALATLDLSTLEGKQLLESALNTLPLTNSDLLLKNATALRALLLSRAA